MKNNLKKSLSLALALAMTTSMVPGVAFAAGVSTEETLALEVGQEQTLTNTPEDITITAASVVSWSSSDESVATVDASGKVKAEGRGNATITLTVDVDGSEGTTGDKYTDTCAVTVTAPSVSIDESASLFVGGTKTLTATVVDITIADPVTATWSSSDETVATVDASGVVTALKAGTATITYTVDMDGTGEAGAVYTDTCLLTVNAQSVSIDETATIVAGKTKTLTVTYNGITVAGDVTVSWSSSDETVATVDASGVVTAIKAGTATITCTVDMDGAGEAGAVYTDTCAVTVAPAPTASLNITNGIYDITVANTTGTTLKYKTTANTTPTEWTKDTISITDVAGLAVSYDDTDEWIAVTIPEGMTAINNAEVKTALNNYATTVTIPVLADFSTALDNLETSLAGTIANETQRTYVKNAIDTLYKGVNTQYKGVKDIANAISTYTTNAQITAAYTQLNTAKTTVNAYTNSTFKTAVLSYIDTVVESVDARKITAGIRTELETNIMTLFDTFYSKNSAYPLANVIIDNANNVMKFNFQQSAGLGSVKKGDLEYWLQNNVLAYIISVDNTWNNKAFTVEVTMPTTGDPTTATFTYELNYNNIYDEETFDELYEAISSSFEYLVFNHTLTYVGSSVYSNDTTGYGTNTKGTIIVIADGEFSRTDSDWTQKNTIDFIDWYTYEVAEPIVNATGKDVRILFYDEDNNLMTSTLVTAASLGGASGNATFAAIQNMLNNEFEEYEDLEFSYIVSGTTKTLNIKMTGKNFRENYDSWTNIDRTDFDEWVEKSIILSALTYQDSDVRVKVYDRKGELLETYEVQYEDVAEDIEDVEDYLNDEFYSWNGIYWDFTLSTTSSGTYLEIEGDFKNTDDEWEDMTDAQLKDWTDSIALQVIESIPRNLTIDIQNKYGYTVQTYSYLRAGFAESLALEETLNSGDLNYDGMYFDADVTYSSSQVNVRLDGINFDYTDSVWKDNRYTRNFKTWLEDNVVTPTVDEFNKDVVVTIYDEDGRYCGSYSYDKDFESSSSSSKSQIQNSLNKYLNYVDPDADSKISASHVVSVDDTVVKVKTKLNTTTTSTAYTGKDSFQYNRFINLILARASWGGKTVELTITDKSGKTINTYTNSNSSGYTYGMKVYTGDDFIGNTYMTLDEKLYKRSETQYDINGQLIDYLRDFGESMKMNLVFEYEDDVTLKISKNAAANMRTAYYNIIMKQDSFSTVINGSKLTSVAYEIDFNDTTVNNITGLYIDDMTSIKSDNNVYLTYMVHTSKGTMYSYDKTWSPVVTGKSVKEAVVGVALPAKNFNDISNSQYKDEILKLSAYGLISGTTNTTFSPTSILTRAQACQLIVNGIAPNTVPSGSFKDVSYGAWYYNAVMQAYTMGIINGYGNGIFGPEDKLTYDQWLMLLKRTGDALNMSANPENAVSTSGLDSASWAINNTAYMVALGVVDRYGYDGDAYVSREAAAGMMCAYLEAIGFFK